MWRNKPSSRLATNWAVSDAIDWHCNNYTGRGVLKFNESGAALAEQTKVLVSKMVKTSEARGHTLSDVTGDLELMKQ